MGWIGESIESVKSMKIRDSLFQFITLGMIVSSALIIWKGLMCITGSESPVVVVLSESMEPGFQRGRDIPIVHRVIEVHEQRQSGEVRILTKGDNNDVDDRMLYAQGQFWLKQEHIMGRAVGFLPYVGWATIIMTEKPIIKYILIGALGLLVITSKD
ncbi:Signal peptidase I [Citrus sinensis]|uniref:Signal peptidase I n=1 Tax=Citrus sinensis TaxID=2711 RepID=A0ACB8NQY9_CITSI|nr:Signal peptidase I [Citrus sinensis]KAH9800262.1 Signal peptidase I [Citrus sinensis]